MAFKVTQLAKDLGVKSKEIAKALGGGGHRQAAGFEISLDSMDKINVNLHKK